MEWLKKAIQKYKINVNESILVGDKITDMECGYNAKIKYNYFFSDEKISKNKKFVTISNFNDIEL